MHQAEPVTIAKLRWLLSKATAVLGEKRLADLSPRDVYGWRFSVPEGHRFERRRHCGKSQPRCRLGAARLQPGQARRPEPGAAGEGEATVRNMAGGRSRGRATRPVYGPMVIFAAATGLRPSELFGLEQRDVDRQLGIIHVRRAYANDRLKHTKTRLSTRAVPLQAKALEALDRLPMSDNPILFPNMRGGLRAPRRHTRLRRLPVHGLEHRDDRPPLRPPRPRQPRTRSRPPRRARARAGRGRCVDVAPATGKAAQQHDFALSYEKTAAARGRSVDAAPGFCRLIRRRKKLISRNFLKPSRGLEPRTPSLPSRDHARHSFAWKSGHSQ